MKKWFILLMTLGFMASLSACESTLEGMGSDLENAGDSIEEEVEEI